MKINVDGVHDASGISGCGDIIRDEYGAWRGGLGFSRGIGHCNALVAELWSILIGLRLAKDLGYRRIEVDSDSKIAVDIIARRKKGKMDLSALVINIRQIMDQFDAVDLGHVFREVNVCAHMLAQEGKSLRGKTVFYQDTPSWLESLVTLDYSNVVFSRSVAL